MTRIPKLIANRTYRIRMRKAPTYKWKRILLCRWSFVREKFAVVPNADWCWICSPISESWKIKWKKSWIQHHIFNSYVYTIAETRFISNVENTLLFVATRWHVAESVFVVRVRSTCSLSKVRKKHHALSSTVSWVTGKKVVKIRIHHHKKLFKHEIYFRNETIHCTLYSAAEYWWAAYCVSFLTVN